MTDEYFPDAEFCTLDAPVMEFVRELRGLLRQVRPPAVEPSSTVIRPELGAADVVIGHRALTGLGIAVGTGGTSATVYWVSYWTLGRSDPFDMARGSSDQVVGRFEGDGWLEAAINQVRNELRRELSIEAVIRGDQLVQLKVRLTDRPSPDVKPVWKHRFEARWKGLLARRETQTRQLSTSFMDDQSSLSQLMNAPLGGRHPPWPGAIRTPLLLLDREGWIHVFDSVERAIVEIEAPDVEADEYLAFDAFGGSVEPYVVAVESQSPWWRRIREQAPIDFRPGEGKPDPQLLRRMLLEALKVDEAMQPSLSHLLDSAMAAPQFTLQAPQTAAQMGHQP